jgi:hypothetical protein
MTDAYPEIAAPPVSQALEGYRADAEPGPAGPTVIQRPQHSAVPLPNSVPLYTPLYTSERGGAVLDQARRGPVIVKRRPSGLVGGVFGAAVGAIVMPGWAGPLLLAVIGNRFLHRKEKNESIVYVKPEPDAQEAVRVKLWKLGSTTPLTDTGLRLVLEARNSDEMEKFLERLYTLFYERDLTSQDRSRIKSYAKHMVATRTLNCTIAEVLSELQ